MTILSRVKFGLRAGMTLRNLRSFNSVSLTLQTVEFPNHEMFIYILQAPGYTSRAVQDAPDMYHFRMACSNHHFSDCQAGHLENDVINQRYATARTTTKPNAICDTYTQYSLLVANPSPIPGHFPSFSHASPLDQTCQIEFPE